MTRQSLRSAPYEPPTLWDRLMGRAHHDCGYCLDAERYPKLRTLHPPLGPRPPVTPPPPRSS